MIEPPAATLLFIYGTLKRGGTNHRVIADQNYLGEARTRPGYRLFIVADYPGLVRDQSDQRGVLGEIWSVNPPKLDELDAFEGVAEKLYRRDPIPLLPPYDTRNVQTYLYLRPVRGRHPIIGGCWPPRPFR